MTPKACFVGARFSRLLDASPEPGSQLRTCHDCGAEDVILGPREIIVVEAESDAEIQILCTGCALPHMAMSIARGDFELDTSCLSEDDLERFKPLLEDPALFLGASILAEKKRRKGDAA